MKNISLRVKRAQSISQISKSGNNNSNSKAPNLLDVFVIGTDAQQQLERFFKISNILSSREDLAKLTHKMEMLELNNAAATNQQAVAAANGNGAFINQQMLAAGIGHQPLPLQPQSPQQHQMNLNAAHLYRQQQQQQQQRYANSNQSNNNIKQQSKHRELPVDVPDSFVGIAKQSPRYPPPKPHRQVSPPMPLNSSSSCQTTFNNPNQSASQHQQATTLPHYNNNNSSQQQQPQHQFQQQPQLPPIAQSAASNLVTHNSSLRSSIKLKQLEKSRGGGANGQYPVGQMQPAVNQAFELNEEDGVPMTALGGGGAGNNHASPNSNNNYNNAALVAQQQAAANQAKQELKMKQTMPDLCSIYNRLQRNLNGEFSDVAGDAKFAKLLSIYNTIVQTHNKQFRIPNLTSSHAFNQANGEPVSYKVSDLLQSVAVMLRDEEMTNDMAELLCILCKHEIDGVCSAFDRIVQSFEFAKLSRPPSPQAANAQEQLLFDGNNVIFNNQHQNQQQQSLQSFQNHIQQPPRYVPFANGPGGGGMINQVGNMPYQQQQLQDYEYQADHQVQLDIENNLYQNSLHPMTDIDPNDGACTKIVHIERDSTRALGATIKNDEDRVVIGRIVCGGDAYRSGLLHEGDEIAEVNGIPMRGKDVNEVVNILEQMNGTLTFKINIRSYNKPTYRNPQENTFVRAFFNFDADQFEPNSLIPCKELGLSFERGEILTIVDRSDPKWWQAHRESDSDARLAGLIPSVNLLKQLEKNFDHSDVTSAHYKHEKKNLMSSLSWLNCPKGSTPRRQKKQVIPPFGPEETIYYEEVSLYYPIKYRKRPIILVGPKMIGQREIVAKLLQDTTRFASAISHTSKPRQDHERNGVDFHFVTRAQFEADMKAGKFIECGQYQNQYYGTSFEAMKEVVRSKKTCIHLVNTPSIFNFRQGRAGSELKPFFVFIKPCDDHPEKLRNLVSQFSPPKSNIEENIKAILAEVQTIEEHYLPYLDLVIPVSDVERAYQDLLMEITKIETEQHWIPSFWQDVTPN